MKKKTLVVLAAGMGSRFGGMKQIEPVGPNGEFIIDYSIYSAVKYGFNKIVFVIKKENYDIFKETIGSRIENHVEVCYTFQELNDIPAGFEVPKERCKPWGTAHALYAARTLIEGNFGVITADDFYGDNAFKVLSEELDKDYGYTIVGYKLGDSLSENGPVKRGVIIHEDGKVRNIIESSCERDGNEVKCTPLDESKKSFYVPLDQPTSMLLNGFNNNILKTIENEMSKSFAEAKDLNTYEFLLPDIIDKDIQNGVNVKVVNTTSTWMGMTYKEDKKRVSDFILNEIEKGIYPNNLWK